MENVEKIVINNLKNVVKKERWHALQDSSRFKEDLSIDSLKMVSVFSNIMRDLKMSIIDFDDAELFQIHTVGELKNLFKRSLEPK